MEARLSMTKRVIFNEMVAEYITYSRDEYTRANFDELHTFKLKMYSQTDEYSRHQYFLLHQELTYFRRQIMKDAYENSQINKANANLRSHLTKWLIKNLAKSRSEN